MLIAMKVARIALRCAEFSVHKRATVREVLPELEEAVGFRDASKPGWKLKRDSTLKVSRKITGSSGKM
jgi:hypothetical protein